MQNAGQKSKKKIKFINKYWPIKSEADVHRLVNIL